MTGSILMWLGAVVVVVAIALATYGLIQFTNDKGDLKKWRQFPHVFLPIGIDLSGVGLLVFTLGLLIFNQQSFANGYVYLALAGAFLLLPALLSFVALVVIHLKKAGVYHTPAGRPVWYLLIGAGLLTLIGLLMWLDGFTYLNILNFPLPIGITLGGGFIVRFYALFILAGAGFVYFLCEGYVYRKFGKRGTLENLFYVAFPAGIVGARIWYVIGNWNVPEDDGFSFSQDFLRVFRVWDGGLAIMGGAIFGALAGIIFVMTRRKYLNVRWMMDLVIPTILIAQAVGRWGNFFNQEVYGAIANANDWWFLPMTIRQQMTIGGDFRVPLFLIESIANLSGYFVLRYAVGRGLKKYLVIGDVGIAYLIWYGLTRFIMEPLRDPNYKMGADGNWSWIWSILFIVLGIAAIVVNHLYHRNHKPIEYAMPTNGVVLTNAMIKAQAAVKVTIKEEPSADQTDEK